MANQTVIAAAEQLVLRSEGRQAVAAGLVQLVRRATLLSQADLARQLGVSRTCVSLWERGLRLPRGETAERLALLLRDLERGQPMSSVVRPAP
jgi:DNA-binding transcriptional regulator YiaG